MNALLTLSSLALALALQYLPIAQSIIIGLGLFGILFINRRCSYLIWLIRADGVSLDVGYYMANAVRPY